jgi:CRISPR-associated protein Csm1
MSEQILLQGKLLGIEEFISSPSDNNRFLARAQWAALLSEVLPRALLAELELNKLLLGSCGADQFLVIIPDATRAAAAGEFLAREGERIAKVTGSRIRLIWSTTENLGDWTVVRKRLNDSLHAQQSAPLSAARNFEPFDSTAELPPDVFHEDLSEKFRMSTRLGWSPDNELLVEFDNPKHSWEITQDFSSDGIVLSRHAARTADGHSLASPGDLATRSKGQAVWGVLRADVDNFGIRFRRAQSIEEHVQLSMMFKHFFARELDLVCSLGEFWQRVTVITAGGDNFAVYGAWDALILLARDMQRVFSRFVEENLKDFPGAEGKTISMAIAAAAPAEVPGESGEAQSQPGEVQVDGEGQVDGEVQVDNDPLSDVYERAGRNLVHAKAVDKDCIFLLGRVLEWKQLNDAIEVKDTVGRIASEFRAGRQFLAELERLYQKASAPESLSEPERLVRRAYRFQRRYSRISSQREREFARLRTHLISEIVGRNVKPTPGKQLKLRPAGVVALEWARLAQEV